MPPRPWGSASQPYSARARPLPAPTKRERAPVLAVGRRVVVTCGSHGSRRVALMDSTGTAPVATVPHGAEVEILAWQPRRAADPRYRVRTTKDGVEGWLEAASLKPIEVPPPPKIVVAHAPTPPAPAPKRSPAREAPAAAKRGAPAKRRKR